jgi:hypothetical protein
MMDWDKDLIKSIQGLMAGKGYGKDRLKKPLEEFSREEMRKFVRYLSGLPEPDHDPLNDFRYARPVAVVDLWDLDDRIERLEGICDRLEAAINALVLLHKEEVVQGLTVLFSRALDGERTYGGARKS